MKRFLGMLLFALSTLTLRADILANGDFHDGKANWKGDAHTSADRTNYDMSSVGHPDATTGVIIDLKNKWSKIFQTFNTQDNTFNYSISYKLSADYTPEGNNNNRPSGFHGEMQAQSSPQFAPGQSNLFLSSILGGQFIGTLAPPVGNTFLLVIVDMKESTLSSVIITPKAGSTDPQTVTGTIPYVKAHNEKTLYLVFPAGKGSVTLLNVALTPVSSDSGQTTGGLPIPDVK